MLVTAYMRGLNKGYSELLARSGLDVRTIEQIEDYLARAEARGAIAPRNGSQPRDNSSMQGFLSPLPGLRGRATPLSANIHQVPPRPPDIQHHIGITPSTS